jgi:CheY-like chemotaxis protein
VEEFSRARIRLLPVGRKRTARAAFFREWGLASRAADALVRTAFMVSAFLMPTLLVVDDNSSVRESLRFLFRRRGYEVLTAESGAEAIALAAQHLVHGAIVDVNMPGMNGVDLCHSLHEQAAAAGRAIAVWMMTGASTPEMTKRAEIAGALGVLGKPFDFDELFQQLDSKLGPPSGGEPEPPAPPTASASAN